MLYPFSLGETVSGIIVDERIDMKSGTDGKYIYDIRHQDEEDKRGCSGRVFCGLLVGY